MNKNKIILIIPSLLLILIGGYFYKNQIQITEEAEMTTEDVDITADEVISDSVQEVSLSYDKDGNLVIIPMEIPQEDLPPMPDLDRKITFSNDFPKDQKDKTTQKIKDIISRLKVNSNSFDDWIELGSNRKQIGDFEGAVESWKYASAISPLNIIPLNNIGNLYHYQLRDYSKAEEYFRKAINVGSSYVISYINLFDLYSLSYGQETDNAENILLEGLENNLNQINLLITLASYYKEQGNTTKALEYYKKTLEQAEKSGNTDLSNKIQSEIDNL